MTTTQMVYYAIFIKMWYFWVILIGCGIVAYLMEREAKNGKTKRIDRWL